jgi:hypothetical protein
LQFWATERGRVLGQIYRDGSVEVWRPLDEGNSMTATVDALRAYLAGSTENLP